MLQSVQASDQNLITDLDKLGLFSFNDNNNCSSSLKEINQLLIQLFSKVKIYGTNLEAENKNLQNKCVSLDAKVQDLSKPCAQCIKLRADIDDFAKKNDSSNKVLFDSDADSRSSLPKNVQLEVDIPRIIKSLTPAKLSEKQVPEPSPVKTPPSGKRQERERDTSPVVQKVPRSGKRAKLSLSAKKFGIDKNSDKVSADPFSELPDALVNSNEDRMIETKPNPPQENEIKVASAECITVSDETVLSDSSIIEPSPVPVVKHRRTKKSNPFLDGKFNAYECVNDDSTLSTVSTNILENRPSQSLLEKKPSQDDNSGKTKWSLKAQRDLSSKNSKFKQTTLGTMFAKKPVDISASNDYKGGAASNVTLNSVPEDMELTSVNNSYVNRSNNKENVPVKLRDSDEAIQESIFYSDNARKKKTSSLNDPSIKVNEIFFPTNKSKDANRRSKMDLDSSQETIFHGDEIKEKKSPLATVNTALQETFFQPEKPNDKVKTDAELNTALQETFFTVQPTDGIGKNGFTPVKPNSRIKNDKEIDTALQETFFNPLMASTANLIIEPEKKATPKKAKAKPVELPKNSFDCIPSPDTPKYKYRRDAVRKKADRQKLPGQECPTCLPFFLKDKDKISETQMEILRKCSRHRDKYPIYSNTPPGIWNPRFDDTDESD
ncbi:uncharacterized protein LOC135841852 [Planococcus citri]|uniref:uncharacterized protein LOC135841852 n=1 Tax=Planococcus citri TaxID=170843 RepID=UPI0031F9E823